MFNSLSMVEEVWVKIPGYYNYSVSSSGKVYDHRIGKILEGKIDSTGHVRVLLWSNSHPYSAYIYILVASIFLPRYDPSHKTRHRDGDVTNNEVSNLTQEAVLEEPIVRYDPNEVRKGGTKPRKILVVETGEIFDSVRDFATHFDVLPYTVYQAMSTRGNKRVSGMDIEYLVED